MKHILMPLPNVAFLRAAPLVPVSGPKAAAAIEQFAFIPAHHVQSPQHCAHTFDILQDLLTLLELVLVNCGVVVRILAQRA